MRTLDVREVHNPHQNCPLLIPLRIQRTLQFCNTESKFKKLFNHNIQILKLYFYKPSIKIEKYNDLCFTYTQFSIEHVWSSLNSNVPNIRPVTTKTMMHKTSNNMYKICRGNNFTQWLLHNQKPAHSPETKRNRPLDSTSQ